jgi:NodT family efflux transporter outer membrane factor (OMF) lipoprotein
LLRRRPDIRRSERLLAAATANIGVATAQLFPQFSLTGTLTVQGSRFQSLGNWGNRFWSFGPSLTWPIFDAGRIWSNIAVENSLQAQAWITYRSTVLLALRDVENSLVAYAGEQQRRAALADAVAANQKAVGLATRRYEQGLTDFLNVLDAERSLYSSQDALVQSNRAVGTDLVALYKALGGGWEIGEPTTQPVRN